MALVVVGGALCRADRIVNVGTVVLTLALSLSCLAALLQLGPDAQTSKAAVIVFCADAWFWKGLKFGLSYVWRVGVLFVASWTF